MAKKKKSVEKEIKDTAYKALSISNDVKAIKKGRLFERMWNKMVGKQARKLMK